MEEKKKVYMYTRVSTAIQVDGYSLDAQKNRMRMFAEFNNYEIVGEYEDAGKSGKSVEGRPAFTQMIKDITEGKDDIAFVLVFKLSRFGRNAADVLSTLQIMQDFDVNLICVEDGIDSSKDSGKLMISVLSAVAEIERDNIRAVDSHKPIIFQLLLNGFHCHKRNYGFLRWQKNKLYIIFQTTDIKQLFRTDSNQHSVAFYKYIVLNCRVL